MTINEFKSAELVDYKETTITLHFAPIVYRVYQPPREDKSHTACDLGELRMSNDRLRFHSASNIFADRQICDAGFTSSELYAIAKLLESLEHKAKA